MIHDILNFVVENSVPVTANVFAVLVGWLVFKHLQLNEMAERVIDLENQKRSLYDEMNRDKEARVSCEVLSQDVCGEKKIEHEGQQEHLGDLLKGLLTSILDKEHVDEIIEIFNKQMALEKQGKIAESNALDVDITQAFVRALRKKGINNK